MSMRLKTTILIVFIVFITTAANFIIGLYFINNSMGKTVEQDLRFAIGIADSLVSTKMNLVKSEAITIAGRLPKGGSDEELMTALKSQFGEFPDAIALTVFDQERIVVSYSEPAYEYEMAMSDNYIEMVRNGATIICSPFHSSQSEEFAMNVCTPLSSGRILAMTIPGSTFSNLLSEHTLWATGNIFILNEEGGFIGGANPEIVSILASYSLGALKKTEQYDGEIEEIDSLMHKVLSTEDGVETYRFGGVDNLCAYSRINDSMMGWRVAVTVPINESPQAEALKGYIYAIVFFLIIGLISAWFLAQLAAQPFKKIEAQNYDLEKLNKTIQVQSAALKEEHSRIKVMLDATPLSCRLWDRDMRIVDCNEETVKLFKLSNKQEYLDRYLELAPEYQSGGEPTVEKVRRVVTEAFEKGTCTYGWIYQTLDGTPIPSEITLVRIPYGDDFVVASYSRDLRDQEKMLAEIRQRDNLLRTVNRAADILLRSDPDDFVNDLHQCMGMMARSVAADHMNIFKVHAKDGKFYRTKLHGWFENAPMLQDTAGADSVCYSERAPAVLKTLLAGECVHNLIRDMPVPDRAYYSAQGVLALMIVPVFIQNEFWGFVTFDNYHSEQVFTQNDESILRSGSLLIANALIRNENMLRIRDTSAQLEIALADAKEANNAKSNFLAHMSHEIRTPLNAVIGLSELVLGEENLNGETESNLEKINSAGSTILSIVNDILDISKIESGKFEIYPVRYDTPSLINDVVTLNIVRIGEKPIVFKLYVDENLPGALFGDDLRVKQVFNNLLSNAFKYTNSGTVEWRVSFEKDKDSVWIVSTVRDTGMGIKPDDIKKLFSEYNQVDMKTNRKVQGTGLGLAITKRLVEMMDGIITVESEYGKGSAFSVRLRQAFVSDTPIGKQVADSLMGMHYSLSRRFGNTKLVRVDLSYAHVLVVDDVITNLDVVKGMMKPYKIKIDCAISGPEAIEMIRAENPRYNAVFMDHMMPDMDGIEAVRIIREKINTDYARNIPIIALTANAIIGNDELFLSRGFQDFVSKPIDTVKLDVVLRRWVRDKNFEKEALNASPGVEDLSGEKNQDTENEKTLLEGVTINGIDIPGVLERFGGNERIFIDVLRSYAINTPPLIIRLEVYLAAKNLSDYAIVVHGIKGASYGIFAQETGKAAEALEIASVAGNFDAVKTGHLAFRKITENLLDEINGALVQIDAATNKPLAAAPDTRTLEELRRACADFDIDRVDKAMEHLESFRYESGGKLVAWLREQINNMTFEVISGGQWPSE